MIMVNNDYHNKFETTFVKSHLWMSNLLNAVWNDTHLGKQELSSYIAEN